MKPLKMGVFVLVVVAFAVIYFLMGQNAVVYEDTNGSEDSSLAIITEEEILSRGAGTMVSGPKTKEHKGEMFGIQMSSGVKFYSDNFSGVYVIEDWNYLTKSDVYFTMYDFEVTAGNFKMYYISETEILGTIEPCGKGQQSELILKDLPKGKYALVIAGESAAFEFTSFEFGSEDEEI